VNRPAHLTAVEKTDFEFGRDYRLALIKAMWESPEKLLISARDFDSKLLEDQNMAFLFDFIKRFAEGSGQAPTRATIVAYIQDVAKSDFTQKTRLLDLLSEIENCQIQTQYAVDRFKKFAIRQKLRKGFKEIISSGEDLRPERVSSSLSALLKDIQDIHNNDHTYNPLDLNKNNVLSSLSRIYLNRQNPIRCGVKAIDDALGGGFQKAGLYFFIGGAGTMKSMTMMNITYEAVRAGKKVAYVDMENGNDNLLVRFIVRFSGLTNKTVLYNMDAWTQEQQDAILQAEETLKRQVNFLNFSITGKNKIEDLDAFIEASRKDMPFDLLIIDSPRNMHSYDSAGLKSMHEREAIIYHKIKGMASKYQVPIVCPLQFNREGNRKSRNSNESADRQDVAGTFEAINLADMVVLLKKVTDDQSSGRGSWIVWHVDKIRSGDKDNIKVACRSDLSRLITHSPDLPQQVVLGKSLDDIMNEIAMLDRDNR
jgi:archaellum biogenesis ATPase FlaH